MTIRQLITLIILALAVAVFFTVAGFADEPSCQTPEQVEAFVASEGDRIAGAAYYSGQFTDQTLTVETNEAIVLYGFKNGCLVAIMPLEPIEPSTPA